MCEISESRSSVGPQPLRILYRGDNVSRVDAAETGRLTDVENQVLQDFFSSV